jgi:tetratricopeptide (TPR) repeat protein
MDTERFNSAIALRDAGRVEEALQELASLVESTGDPEEKASLVLNEATCLTILGRYAEARDRQREAIQISPAVEILASADFGEAGIRALEGKGAEALDKFNRFLREYATLLARPEHRDLYYQTQMSRGALLVGPGRFQEARALLEECLSFPLAARDRGFVLYNLGACYTNLGQRDAAKAVLLEALQMGLQRSDAVSAHYYLGTIYSAERAYAKALIEFEWCLAHVEEGQVPRKHICGWLASTARTLGMKEDAQRYESLAKG